MPQSARARTPRSPITRTACAAAVTVLGTSLLAPAALAEPVEPGTTTIDLYGINDFHGRISEDLYNGSVGVASMASAFAALQAENENSLFVSAGDNIGASTFESMSQQDNPTIDALGLAGLSVSTVGNHEFDRGMTDLTDRVIPRWAAATGEDGADLALGANVYDAEGNPALKEYALRDMGGVTVGFVGTLTEKTSTLVSPDGIAGLTFGDQVEAVNRVSAQLSDGNPDNGEADVVVVLAHDGSETTECSAIPNEGSGYANLVNNASADVDAIFSGHTHLGYACEIAGRPVVQGHQYGTTFAHVSFEVDAEGQIVDSDQALMTLTDDKGEAIYAQDPDVQNIVDAAVAEADVVGSEPLGTITDDILRGGAEPGSDRGVESTLGNLIADLQLWATSNDSYAGVRAEIAFMNPGGLRADLTYAESDGEGDGVVTFKEAADVQPFANTLVTMDLTGADLKNLLEEQWQPEGASRAKLHLGVSEGFSYEYDPDAATGEHITYLELNGEEVDPAATYRVVTNSFLAAGGDNFATFLEGTDIADSGQVDIDATVNFFAAHDDVAPAPLGRAVALGTDWATVDVDAQVRQGESLDVVVTGLEPGAQIGAVLNSDPIVVEDIAPADADGRTAFSIAIGTDIEAGTHQLVVSMAGREDLVQPITVLAAVTESPSPTATPTPSASASASPSALPTEEPSSTMSADPTAQPTETGGGAAGGGDSGSLAQTGATTLWLAAAGGLLLVGGALMLILRARSGARQH